MPLRTLPQLIRQEPGRHVRWRDLDLRTHQAELGPYRIHWAEAGAGEEAVALLHGLSGSSRWWARNIRALADRYRVLIPDVIGFGRSRHSAFSLPDVATVAGVLAEWMHGAAGEPVHLVGHSMGGQLAIHVAARHGESVRRLVLVDAAGLPRPLTPRHVMRFAYEVAPPRRWGDPTFLPIIVGDALSAGPWRVMRALRHILRDDVRPLLPRIRHQTLLMWGGLDTIIPLEHGREMRAAIPDSRLLVLDGAFHNPMVDRPADFNQALLAFLAGTEVGE
ncbi:alpha/beta fold hydrolase [Longimicrobium terrae]|uniref:alpha/beta fold hydrolase n=1 Tax=Longimicrobium terrae TaxID=1639882 RepID=UPI001472B6E6|nr:alpha/beta hydrolase [Longimicrobium terrae]